jgi:hypothetical protein
MADTPNVNRFSTIDAKRQPVQFTVSTDIIDYIESARTFGKEDFAPRDGRGRFQRRMIAVPDKKAEVVTPMVLTIGNQNGFYLVRHDTGSTNGWNMIDLGTAFKASVGNTPNIRALGAAWTEDDRITVAVAVDNGTAGESSRIFVAYNLSSEKTDWENIRWIDCGTRDKVRVDGIRVLDEGKDKTWTIVLSGDRSKDEKHETFYLLRSDSEKPFKNALVFTPPNDFQEILDFEVCVPDDDQGVAVLGINGGKRILSIRSLEYTEDGTLESPSVIPLRCPPGANVLEAGLTLKQKDKNGNDFIGTDLYIGGEQGIYLFTASEILDKRELAEFTHIARTDVASNVQDLVVAEAANGSATIWALLNNGDLNIVKRADAKANWSNPLLLRRDVQEIAPVHGNENITTSLLVVYKNSEATFLWQDPQHGVWQESPLLVKNPEEVTKVTCYGTTLRLLGDGGIPISNRKVTVSASVLSSVVLNNKAEFIGPSVSVETQTDFNGSISIFDRVRSLTPALYRFTVDGVEGSFDVNPAGSVYQQLQSITADKLREAKVIPADIDSKQVDTVIATFNNLAKLANSTNEVEGAPGVFKASTGAAFSSTLQVQSDYRWGIQTTASGVQILNNSDIDKLIHSSSVGEFFHNLGDTIVDFFEGIGNWVGEKIKEGITFILHKTHDAFEFVCQIGEKVKKFVVEKWEQLGSALTWLWRQIKTGLEKVWEYCKFLFNWEDILRVKRAMVDVADETLHYLQASIGSMKASVEEGFDSVIKQIDHWRTEAVGGPPTKLDKPAPGSSFLDDHKKVTKHTKDKQKEIDQASSNSVVPWVMNKINELGNEIIQFDGSDPMSELTEELTKFFTGVVADEINVWSDTFKQIKADVVRLFDGKFPTLDDLNFEVIKKLLISVGADLIKELLTGLRNLVLRFFDLMQKLIPVMRKVLFTKIRFPFIEQLVKLISGGNLSWDTSFTLVDGMMLLLAVPVTISYKIFTNESPLKKDERITHPFLDEKTITVQSGEIESSYKLLTIFSAFWKLAYSGWLTLRAAKASGLPVESPKSMYIDISVCLFDILAELIDTVGSEVKSLGKPLMVVITFFKNAIAALVTYDEKAETLQGLAKAGCIVSIGGSIVHLVLALVYEESTRDKIFVVTDDLAEVVISGSFFATPEFQPLVIASGWMLTLPGFANCIAKALSDTPPESSMAPTSIAGQVSPA